MLVSERNNKKPVFMIRALAPFTAQDTMELSVDKGQILELRRVIDENWIEAYDPLSEKSGVVPLSFFERVQVDKSKRLQIEEDDIIAYGRLMWSYNATEAYEMEAKRGDLIVILDDTDDDWFLAKLIDEPGSPKIVPKNYVRLITADTVDIELERQRMQNNQPKSLRKGNPFVSPDLLPCTSNSLPIDGVHQADQMNGNGASNTIYAGSHHNLSTTSSEDILFTRHLEFTATVERFTMRNQDWYFIIRVIQSDGRKFEISRTFDEFHDLHSFLLKNFPGQRKNGRRLVPFMPAPQKYITETIAKTKTKQLNEYVQGICELPARIKFHPVICEFFRSRPGTLDREIETDKPQPPMIPEIPEFKGPPKHNESDLSPVPLDSTGAWLLNGFSNAPSKNIMLKESQLAQKKRLSTIMEMRDPMTSGRMSRKQSLQAYELPPKYMDNNATARQSHFNGHSSNDEMYYQSSRMMSRKPSDASETVTGVATINNGMQQMTIQGLAPPDYDAQAKTLDRNSQASMGTTSSSSTLDSSTNQRSHRRQRNRKVGTFKCKIRAGSHKVGLRVSSNTQYMKFLVKLQKKLDEKNYQGPFNHLIYQDEDGDWITIASEDDFIIALASHKRREIRMRVE